MAGSCFSNRSDKNISDLIAPLIKTDNKTICSFYIGGFADFSLSDHIFLSPELFYARRGRRMDFTSIQTTVTVINNSIVLPVLVRLNFLKKLRLYAGPELSYVVNREIKGISVGPSQSNSETERAFDVAISAGISFEIIRNLCIDLRFNRGLIDQTITYFIPGDFIGPDYAGQQIPIDYEAYNWSFQIGLKYSFIIKN
jgi:hypothetical protein